MHDLQHTMSDEMNLGTLCFTLIIAVLETQVYGFRTLPCPRMWYHVLWYKFTDVSEEHIAYIFKVEE
jgi:hypothetical protein